MGNNVSQLVVPYFAEFCESIIGLFLRREGFEHTQRTEVNGVVFRRGDCFVEVTYFPEHSPTYEIMVNIGLGNEMCGPRGELQGIGLWYAIPETHPFRRSFGTFSSKAELQAVLTRLRNEVFSTFAKPLWDDATKLRGFVDQLVRSQAEQVRQQALEDLRTGALDAFNDRNYTQAVELYQQIGRGLLSPTELKRLEIAQKRLGSTG